jgi:hypothetical protein
MLDDIIEVIKKAKFASSKDDRVYQVTMAIRGLELIQDSMKTKPCPKLEKEWDDEITPEFKE